MDRLLAPNTVPVYKLIVPMAVVVLLHLPPLWQIVHGDILTADQDSALFVLDFCAVLFWYGLLRRVVYQQERIDQQAERIQSLQVMNEMLRATVPTRRTPAAQQTNHRPTSSVQQRNHGGRRIA